MKIFFAPHYPEMQSYLLTNILHQLDYIVTLEPQDEFTCASLWEDETFLTVPSELKEIAKSKPVFNINCIDISKEKVEEVFTEVFGYSSLVDPTTYQGPCIEKPNLNAVKHGKVINCPIEKKEDGFVYQKLIDARPDQFQREYRVPVIFGQLPMVYLFRKDYPVDELNNCNRLELTPTPANEIFSQEEINKITLFSEKMGMDFGELDILRDKNDNRIFILDANKTPAGYGLLNRNNWNPGDRVKMLAVMTNAFEKGLKTFIENYHQG